nr:putative nuclease HARBI1 isoform X4 [Helicoverpa armigera]XP_049698868.1 putative nuclease HARBI1 isoform X1 [Helicoverpa armigera]XP_049707731.1 putative nuclease HARBI1 [Helicoverpa armigera]
MGRQIARNKRNDENPLDLEDGQFLQMYRISKEMFHRLLSELRPSLQRRRPYGLSVESQILTALRFYACGCYQQPVGLQWGCSMSQKSVSRVIRAVTSAINEKLLRKYIKFPMTQGERHAAKQKFRNAPQPFPGVIGAIDCTHIKILAPKTNEESYVSGHHEGHSLNVQAVCDPDLIILNINARWPGARHDAHIWANSPVRSTMKRHFENGDRRAWLLGDDGYPLEPWLMTPIKHQQPGTPEYKYTEAHCSARNIIERCFGVLKSVFRCLSHQRQLMYEPYMAGLIINACAVLHNMRITYKLPEPESTTSMQLVDNSRFHDDMLEVTGSGRAVAERIRRRLINTSFT